MEIPSELLKVLKNYEGVVLNYKKLNDEARRDLEEFYLMRDKALICEQNKSIICADVQWTNSIKCWPSEYFVIGIDGCGNYYYLNKDDNTVGFYDHDEMSFEKEAINIQQYANQISKFLYEDE